ncbi:MAG: hypothetical protein WB816_10380 [Methylocystis sp.]
MATPAPTSKDLRAALEAGVIDAPTYRRLVEFLATPMVETPSRFDFANLLWYIGALIVLGAMGLFSTTAFGLWGTKALLATSVGYAIAFLAVGAYLWNWRGLRTPGGLLVTCAVGMAPLFVFAIQSLSGHDPSQALPYRDFYVWIKSSWLPMEFGTVAAGLVALAFFPFPFLVMIIAFALWFMSMDLTPWIAGVESFTWDQRATVSMAFGAAMLIVAWGVDLRRWRGGDFAFWLHLFGLMALWGGLTEQNSSAEFGKAIYCLVNVGLIFLSLFLMRRAYAVFGAIGVTLYLGHLADEVFRNSILFPFALSALGVLIIGAGLFFHRHGARIAGALARVLPSFAREFRPAHARDGG